MNWLDALWAAAQEGRFLDGFRAPLLAGVVAAVVSWFATPYVRKVAIERGAVDDPTRDDRRVHKEPTPRWGGVAIYAAIVVSLLVVLPFAYPAPATTFPKYLIAALVLGGLVVVMGALDDLYQYSAKIQALFLLGVGVAIQFFYDPAGRVQIQGIATPLFTDSSRWQQFAPWFAIAITAIYIFVITKTTDTIDGVDGLAAGICTIAATTLCIIASYGGQPRVALVSAAIGGACLGFLRHNYNPAKIFMGTGGAQLLGFMLATISIVGAFKTAATVALIIPVLVFGVPIMDAAFVTIRRVLSRQPITQADKRHLHHTLMSRGLTQRQTVWVLYLCAVALCGMMLLMVKLYG